ncbi:MAG: hypothetical protein FJ398_26830 [Verrucomicrobia bacterium]|nr:hypothetical protein [Verrucomicrobiota bacterium]
MSSNASSSVQKVMGSVVGIALLLCATNPVRAQSATYTVDPLQSSLTLSVSLGGTFGWGQFTVTGQVSRAMVNCFEGTLVATTNLNGRLTFNGGSSIRARLNPGSPSSDTNNPSFHPTGGDPNQVWKGVDNFGAVCALYDQHSLYLAYRDLTLDITNGHASVAGEAASGMSLSFKAGHRDWSQPSVLGVGETLATSAWPIAGGTNRAEGLVTVSPDGSVVTIPVVLVTKSWDFVNNAVTFDEVWTGTIVAVAGTPSSRPRPPRLGLAASGAPGLQFNASAGLAKHYNGITTAPWIEASWIGSAPATYSFTITNPPAGGSTGFQAYLWLVAKPLDALNQNTPTGYSTDEYGGINNSNVVRFTLEFDGRSGATATLGYRANSPDPAAFSGRGFLCGLTGAPFAGPWTISVNNDTDFTITAPDGSQAKGSMPRADTAFFSEKVRLFLGVNPNGARNFGQSINVGRASIITTRSGQEVNLVGEWTSGQPLHKNWTILALDPASVVMMPAQSIYRFNWQAGCTLNGGGMESLEQTVIDPFGFTLLLELWEPVAPQPRITMLANGSSIAFLTDTTPPGEFGFYRLNLPTTP